MDTELLTQRLHHLTDHAPVPAVPTSEDVRRGRGGLRRRRLAASGGALLAVGAVAGALSQASGGGQVAPAPRPVPAVSPTTTPTDGAGVRASGVQLDRVIDRLALRGRDIALRADQVMSMTNALNDAFGDQRYRHLAIGGARSWRAARADRCLAGWDCRDARVAGAVRARMASDGTTSQVVAELPQGVVVLAFTTAPRLPDVLAFEDPSLGAVGLYVRD